MTSTGKLIIGIIIVALIGAWYFSSIQPGTPSDTTAATTTTQTSSGSLPTASGDTSDEAIIKDSAAIDAQLSGLGADGASVEQSLNDKPVAQP